MTFKEMIRQELELGASAAKDPDNAGLPDLAPRTTTIYSPWYTRICPECKLKFREEDRVRICPSCGQAYHDDHQYNLHCWQKHFANNGICKKADRDPITGEARSGCRYQWPGIFPDEKSDQDPKTIIYQRTHQVSTLFLRGLEQVWSPFGNEKVMEVTLDDPIIGHKCPWCRFMIRSGDRVVKCPCGQCNTYFHNDIFRHLTCWNDWNSGRGNDYCPTTGAKIKLTSNVPDGESDDSNGAL